MLDISGIHALEAIVRLYRNRRGDVYLSGVREEVMEWVQLYGFDEFLGDDHFLIGEKAIGHLFHKVLDPEVCIYECKARVFSECQALPKFDYSQLLPKEAQQRDLALTHWSPDQLKSHLDHEKDEPQLVVVDVREPGEYRTGHIPQAQLIPLRQLRKNGGSLPTDHRLVLVCRSGQRSRLAAVILQDMGYADLYNLRGGMISWDLAGYPVAMD
jgi:SulP family sulfate permease